MSNGNNRTGERRRVVITGLGVISALGMEPSELWSACQSGRSGVRAVDSSESIRALPFAAPVDAFTGKIEDFGTLSDTIKKVIRKGIKLMSREIQMAVAAAQRTLAHSGAGSDAFCSERVGVSFASDYIITTPDEILEAVRHCIRDGSFDFSQWRNEGLARMTPLWQLKFLPNMPASHICIYNQFRGHCNAMTNREASIGAVLAESLEVIASGRADVMLTGATGSRLLPFKLIHAIQMNDLASPDRVPEEASRPFDQDRSGMVLGEGAGAVLLEELDHAKLRGAKIYGEVTGAAHCMVAQPKSGSILPQGRVREALAKAITRLLERTGVRPEEIGFIDSCGLSSPALDIEEALAIRDALGDQADRLPVTGLKGHLGNPGAGSGAIELVAALCALENNALYPILNNEKDDPNCPIRPVREFGIPSGNQFLKLAFNHFGQASAILMRRYEG
ncbi:MAG: beta-ketoacyl synthase N-terminal-like domain-containing protein [Planctomycetia bacterium]|nr:beta-ketoacyl synthase N-terminal-like domain-containing protein [Planctomycetia bacterium]